MFSGAVGVRTPRTLPGVSRSASRDVSWGAIKNHRLLTPKNSNTENRSGLEAREEASRGLAAGVGNHAGRRERGCPPRGQRPP